MRLHRTLPALALCVVAAGATLALQSRVTAEAAPPAAADDAIHDAMETLKKGQRSVKKLMADVTANERALVDALRSMEGAVMTSLGATPEAPEGLAGKELEQFQIGYRTQMANLLQHLLAMQAATLKGDADAVAAGYAALVETKKVGHTDYRVDE